MKVLRMPIFLLLFFLQTLMAYDVGDFIDDTHYDRLDMVPEKTYAVSFFASWCASCEKELPQVNRLHKTLDTDRYEIIGIDIDKDPGKAKAFQQKAGIGFRVINDNAQAIVSSFDPIGMPSLYIVRDKRILEILTGAMDDIDRIVAKKLKEHDE